MSQQTLSTEELKLIREYVAQTTGLPWKIVNYVPPGGGNETSVVTVNPVDKVLDADGEVERLERRTIMDEIGGQVELNNLEFIICMSQFAQRLLQTIDELQLDSNNYNRMLWEPRK